MAAITAVSSLWWRVARGAYPWLTLKACAKAMAIDATVSALIAANVFFSIGVIFANKHLFQNLGFHYSLWGARGARARARRTDLTALRAHTPRRDADGPALCGDDGLLVRTARAQVGDTKPHGHAHGRGAGRHYVHLDLVPKL
jgi:hypothetical protein